MAVLPHKHLAPKEKQILQFLCDGDSLKQAAYKLNITYHTSRVYMRRIRIKFHTQTTYKLIADFCKGIIE